jgi:DNA polymerase-4
MNNNNNLANFTLWPRAIIFVDMNAFFASIEQNDFPELAGRPIAVTNGALGTCIITCSYEARQHGVKTGMRLNDARKLCPDLIQRPSRPERYAAVSSQIMQAFLELTDTIEIFSVDEAFLDVTHSQSLFGSPIDMGKRTKQIVYETCGLMCSVGVAADKTTAKYAASLHKPNGFYAVHPADSESFLADAPLDALCGINKGVKRFFAKYDVLTCKDMKKIPISIPAKRFGNIGRRLWLMCQGNDPEPVRSIVPPPKSIGHGKVMPPNTTDKTIIKTYLLHMAEKVATRLRHHNLQAQHFFIGLKTHHWGWIGGHYQLIHPADDGQLIYRLAAEFLAKEWHGQGVGQVQVTALSPIEKHEQLDLFYTEPVNSKKVNTVIDKINDKYGEFTIAPALLLTRSKMPNVIAPSWKPSGHRKLL